MNEQQRQRPDDSPRIRLACLCCGKLHEFDPRSYEAQGVFNVFCDGKCEDTYAGRL